MICHCIFCIVVVYSIFYVYVQEKYCSQATSIYLCACMCEFVVCSRCLNTVFLSFKPPHAVKLLSVLKSMAQRNGPDSFFSFPGKSAAVRPWPNISLTALALTLTWVITSTSIHSIKHLWFFNLWNFSGLHGDAKDTVYARNSLFWASPLPRHFNFLSIINLRNVLKSGKLYFDTFCVIE